MQDVADQSAAPTTIGADLCAIFVSLELSRSTWLATSLSPGRGEKMSKHSVSEARQRRDPEPLPYGSDLRLAVRDSERNPRGAEPRGPNPGFHHCL